MGCRTGHIPLPEESTIKDNAEKSKGPVTRSMNSAGGHLDRMSDDGKRTPQWSISWESATLEYTTDQQFGGSMKEVKGMLYTDGKLAASFVAHGAVADRGTSTLRLINGVEIKALQTVKPVPSGSALKCGEAKYDAIKGLIEGSGGIEVQDDSSKLTGLDAVRIRLLVKDNKAVYFDEVSTPDMFEKEKS